MGRIFALDIGDVWTGTALSDSLGLIARPYKTVKTAQLEVFLKQVLTEESIEAIVVGYPRTLRGTISEQTKKVLQIKEQLEQKFTTVPWVLWDERLTSKRAEALKKKKFTKEAKYDSHSLAATFILDSYLEYRYIHFSK
ncbi:Holliday junction resolvase RuvX [Candidatus Dependentiae bacterium]|nr:MAG: Holliday junction resolvase RuvX [Candidatus Dependentiae bacterium]